MALSANAAKTLDQVKMGLLKLYGAEYFTEEEFIKIDFLIHKGKYLFTSGPPVNVYEEELMSFDDSPDDIEPVNNQIHINQSFQPSKNDVTVILEERFPSPSTSAGNDSQSRMETTPNATSVEESSDYEVAPQATSAADATDSAPMFDFSEPTERPVEPTKPTPQPQTSNGLPPGITQEQLDEARAMQAAMTKAGKKTRPKYEKYEESISEPAMTEEFSSEFEQAPPSPAPTERHDRISSWASEVNAQQPSPQSEITSPAPTKKALDLTPLAEEFLKIHGRKPRVLNDIYQPKNPAHFSNRSGSITSNTTTKTSKTTMTTKAAPRNVVKIGSTYVAQRSQFKTSHILVDVKAGDHLKVTKFVSGTQWLGTNLRTKLSGQISEDVFKKPAETANVAPIPSPTIHRALETVEDLNASAWNEVPVTSRPKLVAPTSAPVRPALGGGLASSRFSSLADREEPKAPSQAISNQHLTAAQIKEFGKIVDEKVDEILKARGMASTPAPLLPTGPSLSRGFSEPLKPVPPKANTCWFWATGKGCRFLAEECRDLHAHLPASAGEPTNLHKGKPTWGALADHTSLTVGHSDPATVELPLVPEAVFSSGDPRAKGLTCWYWAREGKCNYSAADCKYLHEHTIKGVAPRPSQRLPMWGSHAWKRKEDTGETGSGWGEARTDTETDAGCKSESGETLVLEEVHGDDTMSVGGWGVIGDGGAGGWGRDTPVQENTWGVDDRYKPPHVKALEEQARKEAVGW